MAHFWKGIVKLRSQRMTGPDTIRQKGISRRNHQSGTIHRRPRHMAFSDRRAQLSGDIRTPSRNPIFCHRRGRP